MNNLSIIYVLIYKLDGEWFTWNYTCYYKNNRRTSRPEFASSRIIINAIGYSLESLCVQLAAEKYHMKLKLSQFLT